MGLPSGNATGLVVMNVAVNGKSVKFVAVGIPDGYIRPDPGPGRENEKDDVPPRRADVHAGPDAGSELKRTGEAKVETDPSEPSGVKELEGDWERLAQGPTVRSPFDGIHFKNQPADGSGDHGQSRAGTPWLCRSMTVKQTGPEGGVWTQNRSRRLSGAH